MPILSPELEGKPVLVIAFADLDDDGFVGVTELDGDPLDWVIKESELEPVRVESESSITSQRNEEGGREARGSISIDLRHRGT
jgi:hypothetical protein